jgi:hypothetical protein
VKEEKSHLLVAKSVPSIEKSSSLSSTLYAFFDFALIHICPQALLFPALSSLFLFAGRNLRRCRFCLKTESSSSLLGLARLDSRCCGLGKLNSTALGFVLARVVTFVTFRAWKWKCYEKKGQISLK